MKVVLFAALSLDGRVTRGSEPGVAWASPEDQAFLRDELKQCDASIMGAATYRLHRAVIDEARPHRARVIWTRSAAEGVAAGGTKGLSFRDESPPSLVALLSSRGHQRCALLGGTQTYSAFLAADLVDELWLTYEPVLFGAGLPLLTTPVHQTWRWQESRELNASTRAHHFVRP